MEVERWRDECVYQIAANGAAVFHPFARGAVERILRHLG
jgi:hypothetical protein